MIDVHILRHPTQDRSVTLDKLLRQLEREPVAVHLLHGTEGFVGEGRCRGFQIGDHPLVSYVDDDDEIVPGIFDRILEEFEKFPAIDGACTLEHRGTGQMPMPHPYRYYDKRHFMNIHHITAYRRDSITPYIEYMRRGTYNSEHMLVAHLMLNDAIIKHIPEPGYVWSEHDGSISRALGPLGEGSKELYAKVWAQAKAEGYVSHIPDQGIIRRG